jgi:LPS sulfotransferase NodH
MGIKKVKYLIKSALINRFKKKPLGVAMFHFGRVGSTVVSELLNQNPNIKWDNELFQILYSNNGKLIDTKFENDWLKILLNRYSRTKQKVYGFETKAIQEARLGKDFLNIDFSLYLDELTKDGMTKFIILKRKNILKQLLSIERAIQNKKFHYHKGEVKIKTKLHFDPKRAIYGDYKGDIISVFKKLENQYEVIENELKSRKLDYLVLNYEDHIEKNPIDAYTKICDFINVAKSDVVVKQFKIGKSSLLDEISNPEALMNHLKDTPYKWMLTQ